MTPRWTTILALAFGVLTLPAAAGSRELPIDRLRLPPGFEIQVYAAQVPNARTMVLGERGTLFVGTRRAGVVYALRDEDRDGRADEVITIARGLNMPNGLAFRDGALYVAEVQRIIRFDAIESHLGNPISELAVGERVERLGKDANLVVRFSTRCFCAVSLCKSAGCQQ